MIRKTVAEIDLDNLAANLARVNDISKNGHVIAVVKADAYGHGSVAVARRLEKEGIYALGVAFVSEAVELRDAGIRSKIIVFFDNENVDACFEYNLTPVIFDEDSVHAYTEASRKFQRPIDVHIKIDTGMGRVGFQPFECMKAIQGMNDMREITVTGVMSHFSDADLQDSSFAKTQFTQFREIVDECKRRGLNVLAHIANSAGIMTFPEARLDAVRPGLMLYGYAPVDGSNGLKPVMTVKTRLMSLRRVTAGTPISYARTFVTRRPSLIGVIPAGYADGYNRLFSNNAFVVMREKKAPIIGRVCMDLSMVDLTEIEGVAAGDEVTLLSSEEGMGLTARELSEKARTIPYEILTSLGAGARKIYRGEAMN